MLQKIKGFVKKGFVSELAFFNDTQSTFAEAVRTVRTSVLMSALDEPHKVVVITSSVPEEGKTTLSFNLACALGQVKKVLLVDGDLRRPKIGKLVGRERKLPGPRRPRRRPGAGQPMRLLRRARRESTSCPRARFRRIRSSC